MVNYDACLSLILMMVIVMIIDEFKKKMTENTFRRGEVCGNLKSG